MAEFDDFRAQVRQGRFEPRNWEAYLDENPEHYEKAHEIREAGASMEWEVMAIEYDIPTDLSDWEKVSVVGHGNDWEVFITDNEGNVANIDWMTTEDIEDYIWADLWQWADEYGIEIDKEYSEA